MMNKHQAAASSSAHASNESCSNNTNAASSLKKNQGSFFEKHGLTSQSQSQLMQQHKNFLQHMGAPTTQKVVSKISANASSSYNMHRQNATRGDTGQNSVGVNNHNAIASGAGSDGSASNINQNSNVHNITSGQAQVVSQQISRDKPSAKQFSQNMLSKSQQFATLQFNQAMLSQQSYLAQGNLGGLIGGPPQMQQQNFVGSGLVSANTASLNTSSQNALNCSATNYDNKQHGTNGAINSSLDQNSHVNHHLTSGGATHGHSPSKRHGSKTSMSKRKTGTPAHMISTTPHSQPTERTDGGSTSHHIKAAGMLPPSSQSSLAQKRYSTSNLSRGNVQDTATSHGLQTAASQQQILHQSQISKQGGNISKSESNNKLRRISNMKKGEKSSSDRRNQGLILASANMNNESGQGHSSQANLALAQQQYTQSSNPNLRFMQSSSASSQQQVNAIIPANLKNAILSGASGQGAPANITNLTSFQQSHSERTSMTEDPHASGLISMHWQMRENGGGIAQNPHAQCSTERYTNDQKVRFMHQMHSSNENLGISQTSNNHAANASQGANSAPNHGGIFSKKPAKEKLFFVTDHKLYEDQTTPIVSGGPPSEHASQNSSGQNNPHHQMSQAQHQQHLMQQYDIEIENVQVNSMGVSVGGQPASSSAAKSSSMYMSNKGCKKQNNSQAVNAQSMILGSSVVDQMPQDGEILTTNMLMTSSHQHTRGAAAAPINAKNHSNLAASQPGSNKPLNSSIVCPIYQSKDFRLMTGQQSSLTTKNNGSTNMSHLSNVFSQSSKSDQKDVKRGTDNRKESNKGTTIVSTAARRSMSDDMHEDVYMAKSDHQKPRKRQFKTSSAIEPTIQSTSTHHNNSTNSQETYERSHYAQMKKNATHQLSMSKISGQGHSNAQIVAHNGQHQQQSTMPGSKHWEQYSETSSSKQQLTNSSQIKQERRDAEPLADKLLYLTNQACQSKVKSKSQLTQSMKGGTSGLRKGIKSPNGTSQSTLQEPSAKALPTSSKVKISQKFNKFEQSNPAMKMPGHSTKQNLFQTKTLKKQGSGPLADFKESFKSPDVRSGHIKKNGSISYAILPRQVIPASELKAHKKMKSPSPSIKLTGGPDPLQRMRSPQTVKASQNYNTKTNQSHIDNLSHSKDQSTNIHRMNNSQSQAQQLFEARRLSQQRSSHLSHKPPQLATTSNQNKSHLIDAGSGSNSVKHHAQSVSNSAMNSKRISFSDLHSGANKVMNNVAGADEAKKLYCMVDSRKNSQSSLHNVHSMGHNLNQVQILQVDSHGNNKGGGALNKVQLKTKDKLQQYMKPAGFLSQSPKAKKHPNASSKMNSATQHQSSMLMTHSSNMNANPNHSQSKAAASGKSQQKFVQQMQQAYSSANHHMHREMMLKNNNHSSSQAHSISSAQRAILQIQAPKVVHLQSPPSRILVKASPRVSPNPKIRKQAIQTCKVSIDSLQKNAASAQQNKANRASSKEFLKTIKLMKRGSNSPSPSTNAPQHLKSSQASSPQNSSNQNQPAYLAPSTGARQLKSSQHDDSPATVQLVANMIHTSTTNQVLVNAQSQNSNSTAAPKQPQSQQNNKLLSRLQMRRAKDTQVTSHNNDHEVISFSERDHNQAVLQKEGNNSKNHNKAEIASLFNPSSVGETSNNQSNSYAQQLINQFSSQRDSSNPTSQKSKIFSKSSSVQSQSQSKGEQAKNESNQQFYAQNNEDQKVAKKESRSKRSKERHGQSVKSDIFDEKGQVTIEKQISASSKASKAGNVIPQSTPTKKMASKQIAAVAQHDGNFSGDDQNDDLDEPNPQQMRQVTKSQKHQVMALSKKTTKTAVATVADTTAQKATASVTPVAKQQVALQSTLRPNSKIGGISSATNDEMREQQAFIKDLDKLKRMMKMHFTNYNAAPPTTCEFYRIGRVLGKGAFGKVSLAMHKMSEQLVAIKSMSKETLQSEVDQRRRTKLEMGILKQCNHPNVARLFDTFETNKHICFVIELCSGGDLFSYIKKRRRLKEDVARFFFKQLVEGLAYIHNAKKVVHRDIKLENILLDATGNVKICDFGVSRQLKSDETLMKEQCGTPAYIAPEILLDRGYQGYKVDMWCAGVCLYAMLIGSVPFKAQTFSALQDLIIKGEYDFKFQTNANTKQMQNPKAATTLLSEEVQDLIAKLLQVDPNKRLSAVETLNHPWLQQEIDPDLDVYTEKEKQLIQREYMKLNLRVPHSQRISSAMKSSNSRTNGVMTPQSHLNQETEQVLFTEHNLETRMGDEEPQLQNQEEKSFILAPFNSVKSMFIDQGNQIKEVKKDDPPYIWPQEVTELIAPRRMIKFSTKCREKNRIYEQNNNADLDNGVYNEFVNEQEREEGALMINAKDGENNGDSIGSLQKGVTLSDNETESPRDDKRTPGSALPTKAKQKERNEDGTQDERQFTDRVQGSPYSDLNEFSDENDDDKSENSLERSFHETELASDNEEAEQQVAQKRRLLSDKKQNEQAFNLLQGSIEDDEEMLIDQDEDIESPAHEQTFNTKAEESKNRQINTSNNNYGVPQQMKSPKHQNSPVSSQKDGPGNRERQSQMPRKGSKEREKEQQQNYQTPQTQEEKERENQKLKQSAYQSSQMPTLSKQKSKPQFKQMAKQLSQTREYKEPKFVIDSDIVGKITHGNVIPKWYLMQELEALTGNNDDEQNSRKVQQQAREKAQRINYVTAMYFLLCKRKELEELQRRQETKGESSRSLFDTNVVISAIQDQQTQQQREEYKRAID